VNKLLEDAGIPSQTKDSVRNIKVLPAECLSHAYQELGQFLICFYNLFPHLTFKKCESQELNGKGEKEDVNAQRSQGLKLLPSILKFYRVRCSTIKIHLFDDI
jgi:hypothetical protein